MTKKTEPEVSFDIDEITAADQAELVIRRPDGTPTPWVWIIAGPGHPKTIALEKRLGEESLARSRSQDQARVNGKKWKGDTETAEESKRKNIGILADRVVDWMPAEVTIAGEPLPFSRENVIRILMDPARGSGIISQLNDFFGDERAFSKRSETT